MHLVPTPALEPSNQHLQELLEIDQEILTVAGTIGVLHWDQEINMPPKGIELRAHQISTLVGILHQKQINPRIGELLEVLSDAKELTVTESAYLRELKRDFVRETKLPKELVQQISVATTRGLQSWEHARNENNFDIFAEPLEEILALSIERAEHLKTDESTTYDVMLDEYEQGATQKWLDSLFQPLLEETRDLLGRIIENGSSVSDSILSGDFPWPQQEQFIFDVIQWMGYDLEAGRQDLSTHPFTIDFASPQDVRITTRVDRDRIYHALIPSIHETGHAVYEQNIAPSLALTSLFGGVSLGIHESQSRFFENRIGKSLPFWRHWYDKLHTLFPSQLPKDSMHDFYRALNKVSPSLVRVEADELTYNLHIIMRYEIERDLIAKKIRVTDLPEVWRTNMKEYLDVEPTTDKEGVLQDVHWSHGSFGYFPTYTLGNLYSAQITNTLQQKLNIPKLLESGTLEPILEWLNTNIHQWGKIYPPRELLTQITGEDLTPTYFVEYLQDKYSEIYNI